MSRASHRHVSGVTFIEVLTAALIVGLSLASLVSLWSFAYTETRNSDMLGVAYALARAEIEQIKETGFIYQQESSTQSPWQVTWSHYYDPAGNLDTGANLPSANDAYAAVVTLVVASPDPSQTVSSYTGTCDTGTISYLPADGALIQATVTVTDLANGQPLYQTGTLLARSGV